jgi:hypothetical protein
VLEHKGPVTGLRYLLPPVSMLDPTAPWAPSRRLTTLQKGADETEPLACRLFSRTDKSGGSRLQPELDDDLRPEETSVKGKGAEEEEIANNGLSVDELKLINQQLYQFAVKNILNSK